MEMGKKILDSILVFMITLEINRTIAIFLFKVNRTITFHNY